MKLSLLLPFGLLQGLLAASLAPRQSCSTKPAAFYLAGDSTTAPNGGWGDAFVSYLASPAKGQNLARSGRTTVDFVSGGDWKKVIDAVKANAASHNVYVTIQFGHNDQKVEKGISLDAYQANLVRLAGEVKAAGGTPILVTPLTRRSFSGGTVTNNLANERTRTIAAAGQAGARYIDLNQESRALVQALGQAGADEFNLAAGDRTHLNPYGSRVFATLVADLLTRDTCLDRWINQEKTLSDWIWGTINNKPPTTNPPTPPPPASGCAAEWAQCGGSGWTGPKCCSVGTCKASNEWYSQCLR